MVSSPRLAAVILTLAGTAPSALAGYEAIEVRGGGRISGRALLLGRPPTPSTLKVTARTEACGSSVPDERLVVGAGGALANVAVYLEGIGRGRAVDPSRRAQLDHSACRFIPHVQTLATGQVLEIRNLDPVAHAARALLGGEETVFSVALPFQNQAVLHRVRRPGILHLESEGGYPWMSGFILVTDHPYATVTGVDGTFVLEAVPPGRYTVVAWHETLGSERAEVAVSEGKATSVGFSFRPR